MKGIVLAREVLRRIERHADKNLDSGLEAKVNKPSSNNWSPSIKKSNDGIEDVFQKWIGPHGVR